jgi:uncharacterized protein (TIGR01777 family)
MLSPALQILLTVQIALGLFDILYHHELTERLPWRVSQARELWLHGLRNHAYGVVFLSLGVLEPHGLWAAALLALLAIEVVITLVDFVEEDRSRVLPASERVTHAVLALNYGAILALLAPRLVHFTQLPTALQPTWLGWWSLLAAASAFGCVLFGFRDLAASRRALRLEPAPARDLARALTGRRRVLITGATGFIGRRLTTALIEAGHEVTALARTPAKLAGLAPLKVITSLDQIDSGERFDAVVNLAGEPLADGLWTMAKRRRIFRSRLRMTRAVARLIERLETRPEVLVSGSAIGWYGLREDEILDEAAAPRDGFSHRLCAAWERAAEPVRARGVRLVTLRIGLVLGVEGGLLSRLLTPFEFFAGGRIGAGRQWMSWIALDDMVRLIAHAMAERTLEGPVNAVAPRPVRNADFAAALGRALGRPALLPMPAAPLRRALGDFAEELLLGGQRVAADKALRSGFVFRHASIDEALGAMLGKAAAPTAPRLRAGPAMATPANAA